MICSSKQQAYFEDFFLFDDHVIILLSVYIPSESSLASFCTALYEAVNRVKAPTVTYSRRSEFNSRLHCSLPTILQHILKGFKLSFWKITAAILPAPRG